MAVPLLIKSSIEEKIHMKHVSLEGVHTHGGNLEESQKQNNRIIWLDITRSIAILLVVFCHAIEGIYKLNIIEWNSFNFQSNIFKIISFTIGRLGVPLFLFISGYLLLKKDIKDNEDCKKFYKKNLIPLFITVEIWSILYNVLIPIINNSKFDIKELIFNLLFLKQVSVPNMWYMPMIIGIYIAIPFLSMIVKKFDFKIIKIPMIVVFISAFLLPNVSNITKILFNEKYSSILYLSFLGGGYGLYVLLGYYIGAGKFKNIKTRYLLIIGTLSFILTCVYQIWMHNNGTIYMVWYDFCGLLILSVCIFEILSRTKIRLNRYVEKIVTYISKASLGIFFMHIVIQKLILKFINFSIINKPITVIFLTFTVFTTTAIIIYFISKIKFIRQKILLIK